MSSSVPSHDRSLGVGVANRPHLRLKPGQNWDSWNRMVTGRVFRPGDESLLSLLTIVNLELKQILGNVPDVDTGFANTPTEAISRLCGNDRSIQGLHWNPPFFVKTGLVELSDNVSIGENATIWDFAPVHIGNRTLIAPNLCIACGTHSTTPDNRYRPKEGALGDSFWSHALPVWIGDDVWIGANVTILGGVRIGNGCTIGTGSLVSKDIPDRCVAVGVPAKVIKRLDELPPETFDRYVEQTRSRAVNLVEHFPEEFRAGVLDSAREDEKP